MEQETIIYFYPISEQLLKAGCMTAAKKFRFQNVSLGIRHLGVCRDEFNVIGCVIPPFYCRNKPWKPQVLAEAMESVVRRADGLVDTFLHPQIAVMLAEEYGEKWIPRKNTVQMLAECLMEQHAPRVAGRCGEAVILLGEMADIDRQMEMAGELLQPYLSKINRLLIFYEEIAETDIWMELGRHLDDYYYEYGLVPQVEPYVETADGLRCAKHRISGIILDYCSRFRYPKIMPDSCAVYVDTVSEGDKERLLGRKTPQTPYVSPLKYLDTMVKNSYDV